MNTNQFYLRDGRHFIINPEHESDPGTARAEKKVFLLTLNPSDLQSDKAWSVEALRKLAVGILPVTSEDGRTLKKKELIDHLEHYIEAERQLIILATPAILENIEACGYSADGLIEMLARMHGTSLVNEIEKTILVSQLAPTTIVKSLLPEVVKVINSHYQETDKGFVITELRRKFRSVLDTVNTNSAKKVVEQSNNRREVKFDILWEWASNVLTTTADGSKVIKHSGNSWKELSAALSLTTGRRCAEIHCMDTVFSECDENEMKNTHPYLVLDDHLLSFKGQLKTKGRGDVGAYIIPTLIDSKTIILCWEILRNVGRCDYMADDVNRLLSKSFSTDKGKELHEIFELSGVTKYKDLRDIYATKCVTNIPYHITPNAYLSHILGHGADDLATANTYQKIYLTGLN